MSEALVQNKKDAFMTMEAFLTGKKTQLALSRVLPAGMTAQRLVRYAMAATSRQPQLLNCTPPSVMLALMDAAYYGLEPNPVLGHAYLLPFMNNKVKPAQLECQFMIGYKGLILLGERSGVVKGTRANAVYKGDTFHWREHENPPFFHEVDFTKPRTVKDITAVYCAILRPSDFWQGVPLGRSQVERYRERSRASKNGPWVTDWEPMAIKTAVRRAYAKLPLASDSKLGLAIAQDVALDLGEPVGTQEMLDGAIEAPELINRGEELAAELDAQASADGE